MVRLAAYKGISTLLDSLSKILGPLVTIIINVIPDLLRMIFGKSKEQKIDSIRQNIASEVVGKIVNSLRDPVTEMLEEQRRSAMNDMESLINEEAKKYDVNIQSMLQEQQASESEIATKVQNLEKGISELDKLLANI